MEYIQRDFLHKVLVLTYYELAQQVAMRLRSILNIAKTLTRDHCRSHLQMLQAQRQSDAFQSVKNLSHPSAQSE